MRFNLFRGKSTKAERIIYELLKEMKIPFRNKWLIQGRECDFILRNKIVLEIDGHNQPNSEKNEMLVKEGYIPIHLRNKEIYKKRNKIRQFIKGLK